MDVTRRIQLIALTMITIAMIIIGVAYSQEERVTITFYMDTGLGGPRIIDACGGTVPVGENVTCTIRPVIYFDNNTRIVFKGWYRDGKFITNDVTIRVTSEEGQYLQEYVAKYNVEYLLELELGYQTVDEWKSRHSSFAFRVEGTWNLREGVRKLFLKWVGDIEGNNPYIYIEKITKPLKLKAVWITQYYVDVVSDYPLSIESGWFNETETIMVEPVTPVIYENNGETKIILEKYVVDYWIGDQQDFQVYENSLRLIVNSPLTIKASWVKLHHVVLESDHVKPLLFDDWIRDGERLTFNQLEREITWNNGTKIVFDRWENNISSSNVNIDVLINGPLRARAIWKVYYLVSVESSDPSISVYANSLGWVEKGSYLLINATPIERNLGKGIKALFKEWSGSIISSNPLIEISSLDKPVIVKAVWVKKYLITIDALEQAGIQKELWIEEEEDREIIAPLQVSIDDSTRIVFDRWVGCTTVKDNICTLSNVNTPLSISARYNTEKKIQIQAISLNNEVIEDVSFILKHESGDIKKLFSKDTLWMKIGNWIVENATWKGYDVTSTTEFRISEDSDTPVRILVKIFKISFKIQDYLGFPVKDAKIIIRKNDGEIIYEGRTDESGSLNNAGPLPPIDLTAYILYMDHQIVKQINLKTSNPVYITIPFSQTSIQLFILAFVVSGSLITYAFIRRLRKPKEIPLEVPIPLEPPPTITVEEAVEDVEVKKAPIVTLEDVIKKLEMSGEKPEEVLGEIVEEFKGKKEDKMKKKSKRR